MNRLHVNTAKTYDVLLGNKILKNSLEEFLKSEVKSRKILIMTDKNVDSLYGGQVKSIVEESGFSTYKLVFPAGEKSKNLNNYKKALDTLSENLFTRGDTIIALGGGVIGDLAGFVASTYLRGIRLIQIPTTLLSMVDSSVGGKTAVNLERGKNLVGAFYQPSIVIADLDFLNTLPNREIKNGLGEIIKCSILAGGEHFELVQNGKATSARSVELSVLYKINVVESDEFESGIRKLLNLGHTFGHAIEKLSNYKISHGQAVSIGIKMMGDVCFNLQVMNKECKLKIENIIKKYKLDKTCKYTPDQIFSVALSDKKTKENSIDIVAISDIGKCHIKEITLLELKEYTKWIE